VSPCPAEAVRKQLERVLTSQGFARNERLSRFLRVVVERHIEGRDGDLKESVIGVEVFGRKPGFDPKQDSTVRSEAARLRARLGEYYAGEGIGDPVIIELPKGGYTPAFRPLGPRERGKTRSGWPWLGGATAAVVVAVAATGCRAAGGDLEQIQLLLGHASVQTTERYLGTKQDLVHAPNDAIRLRVATAV
jgi:integrase